MPHRPNFTAQLPNKELIKIAVASIGCVQTRGREKGEGSIREFLYDVGAAEIFIGYTALEEPADMRRAARRLLELADAEDDEMKELLSAFSGSMKKLAERKIALRSSEVAGCQNDRARRHRRGVSAA